MSTVGNLNISQANNNVTSADFVTFFDNAITFSDSPINRSVDKTINDKAVKVWTVKESYDSEKDDFNIKFVLDQSDMSIGLRIVYDCCKDAPLSEKYFQIGYGYSTGSTRTIVWNKNFFLIYTDEGYSEADYGASWRGSAYGVEKMYNVETEQYEWKPFVWSMSGNSTHYFYILDRNYYSDYSTNVFRFDSMPPYTTGCGQKITAAIPMFQDTKPYCSRHLYFIYRYQPACDGNSRGTFSLNSKFTDLEGNERPCITIKNMLIFGDVE